MDYAKLLKNFDNISVSSYVKNTDFQSHLLNLNFFTTDQTFTDENVFLFTSENLFLNISYFFSYIYEYWILKILFLSVNYWKWLDAYLYSSDIFLEEYNYFFDLNRLLYSNYTIPFYLSTEKYKLLVYKSQKKNFGKISLTIFKILFFYLKKFFSKNILFLIDKLSPELLEDSFNNLLHALVENDSFELIRKDFIEEFIGISIASFLTKDSKFLLVWVIKVLTKINFRKHWKFLYQFKHYITLIANKFITNSNFSGLDIVIKGKIGALGSVRKKTFRIKVGTFGHSRFYLGGDELFNYVKTETGVIGVKIITSYNVLNIKKPYTKIFTNIFIFFKKTYFDKRLLYYRKVIRFWGWWFLSKYKF